MLSDLPSPREVHGVTRENFSSVVVERYKPVVFRGLGRDWNIVKAARDSAEAVVAYLKGFDKGEPARLVVSPMNEGGRLFYNERLDGFNFAREDEILSAGLDRMLQRSDEAHDPILCFQSVRIPQALPGLEREAQNPFLPPNLPPTIWIGNRVVVPPHFDEASNLAYVAAGRRRITLFPPEQVSNMYVGRLDFTPAGQPVSLVDPRAPDLERFPRFRHALDAAMSVELEAGDAIFIPAPWWHHIESLDRFNVLINYFWTRVHTATAVPFTLLVHAIQALRHLPSGERDAWKALLDNYVFETNGDPVEHLASYDLGILGPMNPDLSQHIHRWLLSQLQRPKQ